MNVLRALVNNQIKKSFYGKRKKKLMFWQFFSFLIKTFFNWIINQLKKKKINILTAFFISYKSDVKTFLK